MLIKLALIFCLVSRFLKRLDLIQIVYNTLIVVPTSITSMTLKIRFLFRALDLDNFQTCQTDLISFTDCVQRRRNIIQRQHKVATLKAYLRVLTPLNAYQYVGLSSSKIRQLIAGAREELVVEFFYGSRADGVRARLVGMAGQLRRRQRELKGLINQLKDESSPAEILTKASKTSFSDFEDVVHVTLAVSEPLVNRQGESVFPLFYEQVDIGSHIQRLRRMSVSECSLSVMARRCHASKAQLESVFSRGEGKELRIVLLFTRVEVVERQTMVSLQGTCGEQEWIEAGKLLQSCQADLLIIIGIGVHLLAEFHYERPLILLTSVSVEENRLGDTSYSRDRFALVFLEHLFHGIFKRQTLRECFMTACLEGREHLENYLWCCCLHGHAGDCEWGRVVRRLGCQQAHRLFRHTPDEWKALKFYPIFSTLQEIILAEGSCEGWSACARDNLCCWNRQGVSKLELHRDNTKVVHWNQQEYTLNDGMLLSLKLNKFDGQICDRPLLRTRPLTLYRVLQLTARHPVSLLHAKDIPLARRFLAQAAEYMRVRDPSFDFCEVEMQKQIKLERELFTYLKNLNVRAQRLHLLVGIVERGEQGHTYQQFLHDHRLFLQNARLVYHLELTISFVVVTTNPSFQGEYPALHLTPHPFPQEKYYEILHNYRSEHLAPNNPQCGLNLVDLRRQIEAGAADSRQEVRERCADIRTNWLSAYLFMGFLTLFADDGFYLTKSSKPIIERLFSAEVVASVLGRKLPVQSTVFPNCVFLQLPKAYCLELTEVDNDSFQLKRLQFYNLLLRVYMHLMQEGLHSFLGSFRRREGLFCISIDPCEAQIETLLESFSKIYKQNELKEAFFNHTNFKTIYHVNQIERIITENLRQKKIKHFHKVKISTISQGELAPSLLLWSIMQKLCLFLPSLQHQFAEKVRQAQALLTLILLKGQVKHTLIEIGRIQLSLILEQRPQKLAEEVAHQHLGPLLTYFHLYALRLTALTAASASPHKFRETLNNCFSLVYKLKECCQGQMVREEFSRQELSAVVEQTVWFQELLRLIQRKVLFYFSFVRRKRVRSEEERDFRRLLNLGQIRYEFQNIYLRLPQPNRKHCDLILLEHYIKISLNEALADNSLLFTLRHGISAEMQPIFQHLCLKVDKRTLFQGQRLVVMGRARCSFVGGQPYIYNRKRYLTMPYLSQLLENTALKSIYFNFTSSTLPHLAQAAPAQILHLLLFIDADDQGYLLVGSQSSVEAISMPAEELAEQLLRLNVKIFILMGRNAVGVCERMRVIFTSRGCSSLFIGLESNQFSMNDYDLHEYPPLHTDYAWKYLQNEVYLMALDFIALSILCRINQHLLVGKTVLDHQLIERIIYDCFKNTKKILNCEFQCTEVVMSMLSYRVWGGSVEAKMIEEGVCEDLTSKYYSSEHNFYHYKYYENVGRCKEITKILGQLQSGGRLIQVMGSPQSGKTTILHEISWTAQIKGFFELGISIFDVARNPEQLREFLQSRKFREHTEGLPSSLMISVDNLDQTIMNDMEELFERLKGKAVVIIFTAESAQVGQRLQKILSCAPVIIVDMNQVDIKDVFGLLLSNIKDFNELQQSVKPRYTYESVKDFQTRVSSIMKTVDEPQVNTQIGNFMDLLRGTSEIRHEAYYNFYKSNYECLMGKFKEKTKMQLKIAY